MSAQVDELFDNEQVRGKDPYQGWTGQGNLDDFNNLSNQDLKWKQARAYYLLQIRGEEKIELVKILPAGANTQFIFHEDAILEYFKTHKLPASVPIILSDGSPKPEPKVPPRSPGKKPAPTVPIPVAPPR